MRAMLLEAPSQPLRLRDRSLPTPGSGELLIRVRACGVCRTDLHILDGELARPRLPLIPGHEIVGEVAGLGTGVKGFDIGDRVGIPWLGWTCGVCPYCASGRENLCDNPRFTGYQVDGGFADVAAAPLLCAGLIGYRTLRLAGAAERIGIYGFGAAAHIVAQVIVHQARRLFAFTRPGDRAAQDFARSLGAEWAGGSDERPPVPLDAALIFAPVGPLVPTALAATVKGGAVVCGGIHMSDIPAFPYRLLWEERVVRSVANLTRRDGEELLALASEIPLKTYTTVFQLEQANEALERLRRGEIEGAAVLVP